MCFYERSIPWLFFTSPLKNTQNKPQSKIKTEEYMHNPVVELLGIIYRNKYLKNCIEIKAVEMPVMHSNLCRVYHNVTIIK